MTGSGDTSEAAEIYALAYTASIEALKQQDATLGNLRTRANALFATAALVTSFSSGLGLFGVDTSKSPTISSGVAWGIAATVGLLGACLLFVLVPVREFGFGADARLLIADGDAGSSKGTTQKKFAQLLTEAREDNARLLTRRVLAYDAAVALLALEVVLLVSALA